MAIHVIPTWEIRWLDREEQLAQIIPLAKDEDYIAVDTETVGWREGNESLALIQIGIPSKKIAFLIDAIKISSLEALREILTSTTPAKLAHNASFEDRQFSRHGIKMKGVRDTLALSRSLRPDLPNHQLRTACMYVLGKEVEKTEQVSDWSQRPLSKRQIEYAAVDVEILCELYEAFRTLEEALMVPPSFTVEEIMRDLQGCLREKFELTKDIAPQLSFIEQRTAKLKESLKYRLENGAGAYQGEYGQASVKQITTTEISTQKVKDIFPEIAPLVVSEKVERKRLLDFMKEFGIDPQRLNEVLEPKDMHYRLHLELET